MYNIVSYSEICEVTEGMSRPDVISKEAISGKGPVLDESSPADARPGYSGWHPVVPLDKNFFPVLNVNFNLDGTANPVHLEEVRVKVGSCENSCIL